jgi:hypothetical protein
MRIVVEKADDSQQEDIIDVIAADYLHDYVITIMFTDLSEKIVDFEPFLSKSLHPSISKYLDKTLFQHFEIKDGNLNWNDYDLIFPVSDLYEGVIK